MDIDTAQNDSIDPDEDTMLEKDFSLISENQKAVSDSDSSYDLLLRRSDANNMEEEESLELFGHEKRALNYLINEYLLQYGYKLTSITFSEENTDEDFEDWESIGLNVSKPPDLGRIYRELYSKKSCEASVEVPPEGISENVCEKSDNCVQCEFDIDNEEISRLKELVISNELEIEKLKLQLKLDIVENQNNSKNEKIQPYDDFEMLEKELRSKICELENERDNLLAAMQTSNDNKPVLDEKYDNTNISCNYAADENIYQNN